MNERLAEAQARIAELEAELAERDSFEECEAPYDDYDASGAWGCSQNYETLVSWHGADIYHKVGEKRGPK
jgi:protein-arginine kinase activator protein McsA